MAMLASVLIFLSACAQNVVWTKPGATHAQFERDKKECEYEAQKATVDVSSGLAAGFREAELIKSCLQARGYTRQRQ
jgi:hypothetical protein